MSRYGPGFCDLGEPAPPGFFTVDLDPYSRDDDAAWELAEELGRLEAFAENAEPLTLEEIEELWEA